MISLRASSLLLAFPLVLLCGCEIEDVDLVLDVCNPMVDTLDPAMGTVDGGDSVTLSGLFVGTELGTRDVTVHVGGSEAEVTGVFRGSGCSNCDACITEVLRCAECERVCRGQVSWDDPETEEHFAPEVCEEWVSFLTPATGAPGEVAVLLTNSHGSTQSASFEYTADAADDDDSAH